MIYQWNDYFAHILIVVYPRIKDIFVGKLVLIIYPMITL